MKFAPGNILISAPSLHDPNFEKVVIFITEYNEKGALGFVINKLFHRVFNNLVEFKNSAPLALYEGGPVEKENLYFLHQRPDLIEGGTQVCDTIYYGGNFKQAVALINNKLLNEDDVKLFVGYCGWDAGQLEEEIEEGSWLMCNNKLQSVFSADIEMLWELLYEEMNN